MVRAESICALARSPLQAYAVLCYVVRHMAFHARDAWIILHAVRVRVVAVDVFYMGGEENGQG